MSKLHVLRDGRRVTLQPLLKADAPRVARFVEGLSWQARVERFFAPVVTLSAKQLERLTSGPGVQLAAANAVGDIVALAQYAPEPAQSAEFAVVVADAWQGVGLGEAMVGELMGHARAAGIAAMEGVTRPYNTPMRRLASKLGFALRRDTDPTLLRMERLLAA